MVVVVLGHRLRTDGIHGELRGRMDVGIELFRTTDADRMVVSGGWTNPDIPSTESEVMRRYAVERGVDPESVVEEPNARDTIGNGYFTRRVIENGIDTTTVRVVTSCYHTERAAYVFEQCFGDASDIVVPDCHGAVDPSDPADETDRLSAARRFFEPIEPGDVDAIRERLIERHDLYGAGDFDGGR